MLIGLFQQKECLFSWLLLTAMGLSSLSGCSRQFWRQQADKDSYHAISERLNNPHWNLPRIDVTPDPRSRFFDPYNPDKSPLPPDDPAAHIYMHCSNGWNGYKGWHKMGTAFAIENPQWLDRYGIDMQGQDPVLGHSQVKLLQVSIPETVDLASINSREYQSTIEDLYISALALTFERFKLGVRYLNAGGVEPGADITYQSQPSRGSSRANFGVSQLLPSGGQLALEIANTVTFGLGPGTTTAPNLAYSFTQPLLFSAGRKVVLENLTQSERSVLYNARTLARFRQILFVRVTSGYLGLLQQRQRILNTTNNIRLLEDQLVAQEARDARVTNVASGALDGAEQLQVPPALANKLRVDENFLVWEGSMSAEEEQQLLQISDDPDFQAAAQDLIGFKKQRAQTLSYLQLRGQYNSTKAGLAQTIQGLADAQDSLKLVLGLPPNVTLEADEDLLNPFELISPSLVDMEAQLRAMQVALGSELLPERQEGEAVAQGPRFEGLKEYVSQLLNLNDNLYEVGLQGVRTDFENLSRLMERTKDDWADYEPGQRYFRSEEERTLLFENLETNLRVFRTVERNLALGRSQLLLLSSVLNGESREEFLQLLDKDGNGTVELSELPEGWGELPKSGTGPAKESFTIDELLAEIGRAARIVHDDHMLRVSQGLQVVQIAIRVELIPLNPFTLDKTMRFPEMEEVVAIALENRHDLMNARAAVTDARRGVEIAANALQAGLDVTFSGQKGLGSDAGSKTSHAASLSFTTPLDQITERNNYRNALITYQRTRRSYMELEDQIKQDVRQEWRTLRTQEYRIEIDRATVRINALQYDNASLQAAGPAQNNALSLVNALNGVLNAQNSLVQDWVTYETNRLNIYRDMGIMEVDPRGVWTDAFYQQMDSLPTANSPTMPADAPDVILPPAEQ